MLNQTNKQINIAEWHNWSLLKVSTLNGYPIQSLKSKHAYNTKCTQDWIYIFIFIYTIQ